MATKLIGWHEGAQVRVVVSSRRGVERGACLRAKYKSARGCFIASRKYSRAGRDGMCMRMDERVRRGKRPEAYIL